ncbi:MAG TPA: ABC transporter substrate-binding protein, partial [Candidatus Binatia bacterium]
MIQILDFRFWIFDWERKRMNALSSKRISSLYSDNLKSAIKNRKWAALSVIAFVLVAVGPVAQGQQPEKIPRIGYLDSGTASGSAVLVDAFRQELRKLGWVEGKNITIEYRFAENKGPERLTELAADLVRLKVDLILTSGAAQTSAAKRATTTIPIVMGTAPDPVAAGFVASLARPGGNITGLSSLPESLITKRLEVLKDAVPKLARVGVIRPRGASVAGDPQLEELRPAAQALKIKLEEI